jgi:CHASE2 domain-containing sensor protein
MDLRGGWVRMSLVLAVVATAALLGWLRPVDDLLADTFTRLAGTRTDGTPRQVLLVEAPIDDFVSTEPDWEASAQRLLALGALRVAFTALPTLDPERLGKLIADPRIDVATGIDRDPLDAQRVVLRVTPEMQGLDIPAVVMPGDGASAVRRRMPYAIQVDDRRLPTLQALVARELGQDVPAHGTYRIGFLDGAPRDFPRAELAAVDRGELIEEAVSGRVALVGPVSTRFDSTVVTPMGGGRQTLSTLEFHGYALDSLLRARTVGTLPPWGHALLVVLAGLLAHVVIRPLSMRRATAVAALGVAALVATSALLLPWALFHLPVTGASLALVGVTLSGLVARSRREGRTLGELATTSAMSLVGRLAPNQPRDERELWDRLLERTAQFLPIERAILLKSPPGEARLVAVAAFGAEATDLAPQAPDPQAAPFTVALDAAPQPVEVTELIGKGAASEQQLLIALAPQGRLVGFLVCGVDRERLAQWPGLKGALSQVAAELAELMLERRGDRRGQARGGRIRSWAASRQGAVLQRLVYNLHGINRRLAQVGEILDGLHTPVLACDTFGRTIAANRRMQALLSRRGLAASASAADVIDTLSGAGPAMARDVVAGALFHGRPFERSVEDPEGGRWRLRAVPMTADPRAASVGGAIQHGLIIEVAQSDDVVGEAGADLRLLR